MTPDASSTTSAIGTDRLFVTIDNTERVVRICLREYEGSVYTDELSNGVRITFAAGSDEVLGIEIPARTVQVEAI